VPGVVPYSTFQRDQRREKISFNQIKPGNRQSYRYRKVDEGTSDEAPA
jgi:hypothetical protein